MKKLLFLSSLLLTKFLFAEENVGFLMNQKYICFYQFSEDENGNVIHILSKEDAMNYPIRFYVDEQNILHTDAIIDPKLKKIEKTIYGNSEIIFMLVVENNKRYLITTHKQTKELVSQYGCDKTDNWTLR